MNQNLFCTLLLDTGAGELGTRNSNVNSRERASQATLFFLLGWEQAAWAGRACVASAEAEGGLGEEQPDGVGGLEARFICFGIRNCKCWVAAGGKVLRGTTGIRGRQSCSTSFSFFFALQQHCMEESAKPKIPSGMFGISSMSSFSLSDRFARLNHHVRSCSTMVPSISPVVLDGAALNVET